MRHETDDSERKGDTGEQKHTRGDHSYHDGNGTLDCVVDLRETGSGIVISPVDREHKSCDRNNEKSDDEDDKFCGTHEFRIGFFIFFSFGRKGIQISVFADFFSSCFTGSAGDEAARIQEIARFFFDGNGFAREQRFIDFDIAFRENAIGGDLISEREHDDIIENDVFGLYFLFLAVADHGCGRCCQQ